jgi:hypothetical protein
MEILWKQLKWCMVNGRDEFMKKFYLKIGICLDCFIVFFYHSLTKDSIEGKAHAKTGICFLPHGLF